MHHAGTRSRQIRGMEAFKSHHPGSRTRAQHTSDERIHSSSGSSGSHQPHHQKHHHHQRISNETIHSVKSLDPPLRSILHASGDHHYEVGVENKSDPKKLYLIASFVVYALILSLQFGANIVVFILLSIRKMEYYVRFAPFFDVVYDVPSLMAKFMFGTACHLVATIYTIFVLKGSTHTESLVLRFQDKFLSWLVIGAAIGEGFIISAAIDYFSSRPIVHNGGLADTILPPGSKETDGCFKPGATRKEQLHTPHVFINLAWLWQVLCSSDKGKDTLYEFWLHDQNPPTPVCAKLRSKLTDNEKNDCKLAMSVDLFMYSYLVMATLGLVYCICLWYVYLRTEVHTRPARFSLVAPLGTEDLYNLRDAAEKVKAFTSQQMIANQLRQEEEEAERERERKKEEQQGLNKKAGSGSKIKFAESSPSKAGVAGKAQTSKTKLGNSPSRILKK